MRRTDCKAGLTKTRRLVHSPIALLMVAALGLAIAGCAAPAVDTDRARELAKLSYPETAQQGPALDIVVHAVGNDLHLANRTARRYENMQLWLNRQYVRRVEAITISTDNSLPLPTFINRFREPFPIGGILSPEDRRPVILAELYDPEADVRYPLVARPDDE